MSDLIEGQVQYVQGSGKKPYELQLKGGVYSCSCPAWRNQSNPIDKRTCKHLKMVRGDAAEALRVSGVTAVGVTTSRMQTAKPNISNPPREAVAVERLEKMKAERPEEYEKLEKWVDGLPETKQSFGCACERGSSCDVNHDPASCSCALCSIHHECHTGTTFPEVLAKRAMQAGVLDACKDAIISQAEKRAGRKLRPDEKTKLFGPPVLLAHPFEDAEGVDPSGWWMSEKLDGVRAWWDGKNFVSRQGNIFYAPDWFKAGLPDHPLDGELWIDRRAFQQTISIVKSIDAGERWKAVKYMAFDMPHLDAPFERRYEALDKLMLASASKVLKLVQQRSCTSLNDLKQELQRVVKLGAEGLMIRKPGSLYETGRSWSILKVKPWKEAEARVVGYEAGKGRHKGRTGGLVVKLDQFYTDLRLKEGVEFNIGTGLSDEDRRNPPAIGKVVTFRYMDTTDAGVPKGASFVAVRDYE